VAQAAGEARAVPRPSRCHHALRHEHRLVTAGAVGAAPPLGAHGGGGGAGREGGGRDVGSGGGRGGSGSRGRSVVVLLGGIPRPVDGRLEGRHVGLPRGGHVARGGAVLVTAAVVHAEHARAHAVAVALGPEQAPVAAAAVHLPPVVRDRAAV